MFEACPLKGYDMSAENRQIPYIATRYFLSKPDQIHTDDILNPQKPCDVFSEWINGIDKSNYLQSNIGDSEYRMYFCEKYGKLRILFKFSKKTLRKINDATDIDIESKLINDYPFSYILIDTKEQLVLIQKNSQLNSEPKTTMNLLAKVINKALEGQRVIFKLSPITETKTFWSVIDKHKGKLETIEFDLLSPNYLGAEYDTNELLREIKDECNNDSAKITLKSDTGNLALSKNSNFITNMIEYITNGGGRWFIKPVKQARITSEDSICEVGVEQVDVADPIPGETELDWALRQINDIESTNKKDDE